MPSATWCALAPSTALHPLAARPLSRPDNPDPGAFATSFGVVQLTQYPTGLVAIVSDSYNVFEACSTLWGGELKDMVKGRGGFDNRIVIRPDSGEPTEIVPQLLDRLGAAFSEDVSKTPTGHKLLPPYLRMIQGDGISYESLGAILDAMAKAGWAAENLAFGSGGALLQKLNRDTQKCAFKCSEITKSGGETTMVYKDPVTDKGKQSKKGKLTLERSANGALTTVTEGKGEPRNDVLVEVFRDGDLCLEWTFEQIRLRAALPDYAPPTDVSGVVVQKKGGSCCALM